MTPTIGVTEYMLGVPIAAGVLSLLRLALVDEAPRGIGGYGTAMDRLGVDALRRAHL